MRTYPDTLVTLIKDSGLNINQISKMSGISNTYLTKLMRRQINHPGKDKIASVLLALNHTVSFINQTLAEFDYQPLNEHDIPQLLENNRRRRFEGRVLPHYDSVYFELVLAALEDLGGTKIVIWTRPSANFLPVDLYMEREFPYPAEVDESSSFYRKFTREIITQRKALFLENCRQGMRYETYICRECLDLSLERNIGAKAQKTDPNRVNLVAQFYANVAAATLKFPDQHIYGLMDRCTYFQFQVQDADGDNPKVSFTTTRNHPNDTKWEAPHIQGFFSNAPGITDLFLAEVDHCRQASAQLPQLNTAQGFVDHIRARFDHHGVRPLFDRAFDQLMAQPEMTLL